MTLAAAAMHESLWVDELHTDWVISAGLGPIVDRAEIGNQSPGYFYGLYGLRQTLGLGTVIPVELQLRLPSLVAWLICIALIGRALSRPARPDRPVGTASRSVVPLACALIALDRVQLFYATEARVFMLLQLLSLTGWLLIDKMWCRLDLGEKKLQTADVRLAWAWSLLAIVAIHLHLTAIVVFAVQYTVLIFMVARRSRLRKRQLTYWLAAGVLVALATAVAVWSSGTLWQRRHQWEAFAGTADWKYALNLFPFVVVVPVLLTLAVDRLLRRGADGATDTVVPRALTPAGETLPRLWLWAIAALGPWLMVWAATASQLAPLMHRRYTLPVAIPLFMLIALLIEKIQRRALRVLCALCCLSLLLWWQGTLAVWRSGDLVGWLRAEGWRQASAHLQKEIRPEDQLWCASGLIEGELQPEDISLKWNRYLSYPLRGSYRLIDPSGELYSPGALVNDPSQWLGQCWSSRDSDLDSLECWIVCRAPVGRLLDNLRRSRLPEHVQMHVDSSRGFGRVSLAKVILTHSPVD